MTMIKKTLFFLAALSIYANQLIQKGGDVLHGMIREVSLCLAGANPGAKIEDIAIAHFDEDGAELEAQVYNGENIELYHSDDADEAHDESEEEAEKRLTEVAEIMRHREEMLRAAASSAARGSESSAGSGSSSGLKLV